MPTNHHECPAVMLIATPDQAETEDTAMSQPEIDGERRSSALRIAGLAVLVVVALVGARARAAGVTTPMQPPNGSVVQAIIRIVALTVLVAAAILLLGGGRIRRIVAPGAKAKAKKKAAAPLNRRVVIAALVGLLFAFGMQILGNAEDNRKPPPPPPLSAQSQGEESPYGRKPPPPNTPESGISGEVFLVASIFTLGMLVVVLMRRRTEFLEEEDEEEDEDESMAKAMRAARAAVLDQTITDPRSAIVACFAAMEDALSDRGGAVSPRESDTPTEVLHRGIERASLPEDPAFTLLRLFRVARFSTHPITDQDRGDADDSLRELLRALGSPASRRSGDVR